MIRDICIRDIQSNNLLSPFLSDAVFVSGLLAVGSAALLGIFCILSIIQHAMISSREKVVMPYTSLVIVKLIMALLGGKFNPIVPLHMTLS